MNHPSGGWKGGILKSMKTFTRMSLLAPWVVLISAGLLACNAIGGAQVSSGVMSIETDFESPVHYTYSVINTFDHDCNAFTQGLIFENGRLFEGTGQWTESNIREVELATGNIIRQHDIDDALFGEGITIWEDQIIQITWKAQRGFVYERDNFELVREFTYTNATNEGWGITHNGEHLIMSDGSANLYFLDPNTFGELSRIQVIDPSTDSPVFRLNELEYINGLVFANIWFMDLIAVIDPETGLVGAWIDMAGLKPSAALEDCPSMDVLNGIAYDADGDRLLVTGKYWHELSQIELIKVESGG